MAELKAKHEAGTNERDDPERAPTGSAYRAVYEEQKALAARARAANEQRRREDDARAAATKEAARRMKFSGDGENNGGGDGNDGDDAVSSGASRVVRDGSRRARVGEFTNESGSEQRDGR